MSSSKSSRVPFSGRLSDTKGKAHLSTDEKLESIFDMLTAFKEDMKVQMKSLKEEIKRENTELIERLEGRVFDLEEQNDDLKQTVQKLEQKLADVEDRQCELENNQNDLEQQGRKNSIRIVGLEDINRTETVEECVGKIVRLVIDELKIGISKDDVDIVHRLGVYQQGKPRNVICKFIHRTKKIEIIKKRKVLKGSGRFIMEDVTRKNQQRLKEAFELDCVERTWNIDGKLFILLKNGKKTETVI